MRHSSFKLRWYRYYQFLLEGQAFYLKLKAYTNKYEGLKEWELITERTYRNAISKGYHDNVVIVEEEVAIAPVQALTLIFNEIYDIDEKDMRKAIIEGQESIRELRRHGKVRTEIEYSVFKKILKLELEQQKYKKAI